MPNPIWRIRVLLMAALASCVQSPIGAEKPWPTDGWAEADPSSLGLDALPFARLDEAAMSGRFPDLHSLLVVKNGHVVYERYLPGRDPSEVHTQQSVSKSVTSTLMAIALERGRLSGLDAPLVSFFSDRNIANLDERKRSINLEHVLRMRAGFEWNERSEPYESNANSLYELNHHPGDWYQLVLDTPMAARPGEQFLYNSGGSILLSGVLDRVTGQRTDEFAMSHLFAPLGIDTAHWTVVNGVTHTGGGLALRTRDMAKIGYLYLRDGMWDGTRLLPEGWVERATTGPVASGAPGAMPIGYGLHWWLLPAAADLEASEADSEIFAAWGHMGQFIFVVPQHDLVFVTTGGAEDFANETRPFDILYDYVIPAADPSIAFTPPEESIGPGEVFQQAFGGSGEDRGIAVASTQDGGYVTVGVTTSEGAGAEDVYLVRTDAEGNPQYQRTFGGTANDCGWSIVETRDGGFAIAGFTDSFGAGGTDAYLIRTDAHGDTLWTRTYGGAKDDLVWSLLAVEDGFLLAGQTASSGAGDADFYLLRTDPKGLLLWEQTYGGPKTDRALSVQSTGDGGFLLGGFTTSFGAGDRDGWVVKTDAGGNEVWNRTLGSPGYDVIHSVCVGPEPGSFAIGYSSGLAENGGQDAWVVRLDPEGQTVWSRVFGEEGDERLMNGVPSGSGGITLVGYSRRPEGLDAYLAQLTPSGSVEWTERRGGRSEDSGYGITSSPGAGVVVTGLTKSFGSGNSDLWLFRLEN